MSTKVKIETPDGNVYTWYAENELERLIKQLIQTNAPQPDLTSYLTKSDASNTYLNKTDASNTYLGKTAKAASATSADSATKATQDASGNTITSTYLKKTDAADSAKKLSTARTIRTDLTSTDYVSFDGSENVMPGVKGILPLVNGGTGQKWNFNAYNLNLSNINLDTLVAPLGITSLSYSTNSPIPSHTGDLIDILITFCADGGTGYNANNEISPYSLPNGRCLQILCSMNESAFAFYIRHVYVNGLTGSVSSIGAWHKIESPAVS